MEDIERFWSYVDQRGGPAACWPWMRSRTAQGYGQFYPRRSRKVHAHRWLLGFLRGAPLISVPRGVEDACHRCDNPPCCNPAHLYVGTRKQNAGDAVERSRLWMLKQTHCPRGHPYDEQNTYRYPSENHRVCRICRQEKAREANEVRTNTRLACRNGHSLAGENLLLCRNGRRKCRACDAVRAERHAERLRTAPKKTHCVHGHPLDEANTYIRPDGSRQCRTCQRQRRQR